MSKLALDFGLNIAQRTSRTRWLTLFATTIALTALSLTIPINSPIVSVANSVGSIALHTTLLMGALFLLLRYDQLPAGGITTVVTIHTAILSMVAGAFGLLPLFMLSAAAGDVLLYNWKRADFGRITYYILGAALPLLLFSNYFALLFAFGRLTWSIPMTLAAIGVAELCGLMMALLAFPPIKGGVR